MLCCLQGDRTSHSRTRQHTHTQIVHACQAPELRPAAKADASCCSLAQHTLHIATVLHKCMGSAGARTQQTKPLQAGLQAAAHSSSSSSSSSSGRHVTSTQSRRTSATRQSHGSNLGKVHTNKQSCQTCWPGVSTGRASSLSQQPHDTLSHACSSHRSCLLLTRPPEGNR